MKKMHIILFLARLFALASCKKLIDHLPPGTPKGGSVDEKKYTLKKLTHGRRQWIFYFNKKRLLDSVGIKDTHGPDVYRVVRRKDRIDSVAASSVGAPSWYNHGFVYDKAGNITKFDQSIFVFRTDPPIPFEFTYLEGYLHTMTCHFLYYTFLTTYDTLNYVNKNIARWATGSPLTQGTLDRRFYTYDRDHLNPLFFIDDLIVVFSFALQTYSENGFPILDLEDRFLWEFILSPNVSMTKFYDRYQETIYYENSFDSNGRITKKKWTEHGRSQPDSLTFEYGK